MLWFGVTSNLNFESYVLKYLTSSKISTSYYLRISPNLGDSTWGFLAHALEFLQDRCNRPTLPPIQIRYLRPCIQPLCHRLQNISIIFLRWDERDSNPRTRPFVMQANHSIFIICCPKMSKNSSSFVLNTFWFSICTAYGIRTHEGISSQQHWKCCDLDH